MEQPRRREISLSRLKSVIKRIEKHRYGSFGRESRIPGTRKGSCGLTVDAMTAAFQLEGFTARSSNAFDLNELRGIEPYQTEFHEQTIAEKKYLVDIPFAQFLREDGLVVARNNLSIETPLGQQLLNEGFFMLTDDSLCEYLDWLTDPYQGGIRRPIQEGIVQLLQESLR